MHCATELFPLSPSHLFLDGVGRRASFARNQRGFGRTLMCERDMRWVNRRIDGAGVAQPLRVRQARQLSTRAPQRHSMETIDTSH
jgi:hypothetical protein